MISGLYGGLGQVNEAYPLPVLVRRPFLKALRLIQVAPFSSSSGSSRLYYRVDQLSQEQLI